MKIHPFDVQRSLLHINIVLQHNIKIAVKSKVISKEKKISYAYAASQQEKCQDLDQQRVSKSRE